MFVACVTRNVLTVHVEFAETSCFLHNVRSITELKFNETNATVSTNHAVAPRKRAPAPGAGRACAPGAELQPLQYALTARPSAACVREIVGAGCRLGVGVDVVV